MKEGKVRELANRVLSATLGPIIFAGSDVTAGPDHYGDESLFVTVRLSPGSDVLSGRTASEAMAALRRALEEKDETRFPYLSFDYLDEEAPYEHEADAVGS